MSTVSISCYDINPNDLVDLAEAADGLGFHRIWLGEHLFRAAEYASSHPRLGTDSGYRMDKPLVAKGSKLVDQWVTFGAAGRVTNKINLATGIHLLTLRHPLITARSVATAHELAGGRVVLGAGAGWLIEEFEALAIPFSSRMSRFEECIEILRLAWSAKEFSWSGKHFEFEPLQVCNDPIEVPIILGGNGPKALERAVRLGDGWFASGTPVIEDAVRLHEQVGRLRADLTPAEQPFDCYFRIERADRASVERYRSEGMDNVLVWSDQVWKGPTLEQRRESLARAAEEFGLSD